jgi:hypothetical protein
MEVKEFQVTTVGSYERVYTVKASNEEQARKRMRAHIADPEMLGEGVVVEDESAAHYVSGEQIKSAKEGGPAVKAVPEARVS